MEAPIKVFLSSTYSDLAAERKAILMALEILKLQYASMEFFGAKPDQPIETCLAEVRDSDALVVVIGHRYGSYVPGMDVSFTEAEYEEGYRLGKPSLVYIKDDNVPVLPTHFEQDPQKLRSLLAFKEKLKQRHTVYFFSDLTELAVRVAVDLGITVQFIKQARGRKQVPPKIQFYSCFISYSHENKPFARRLHDALQGRGIRCWLDEHQLLPGDKIYTEVDRGIRLWDKVLLCCSKESLASWWVENEIQIAFDKEQQLRKQRGQDVLALIPLNLDGYLFDGWESGMATQIRARLAADFTGWETDNGKFESEFEKLVKALRADAGGRESPPQSRL